MAARGRAFCPGHLTAFFQVVQAEDPLRTGSRGAGLCLSRGVETEVEVRDAAGGEVTVYLDGERRPAETTERAVALFLEEPRAVTVRSEVQLPVAQGFGMSGAGALSTLLALNDALGEPRRREEVVALAHRAEVEAFTGLGDVVAQAQGGLDIRERPGGPPHGKVHKVAVRRDVVLCVLGPPTYTKAVLKNPMVLQSVNSIGKRCVDRFLARRDVETFFRQGWLFARQTVLATTEIQAAVLRAQLHGQASMVFIGNSVFAMGDTDRLAEALREFGDVHVVAVDNEGARVR